MSADPTPAEAPDDSPWYRGITRYQWVVLIIASLGWVFDVFEGQIFVASMNEAMPSLLPKGTGRGEIAYYNNIAFAAFLVGGALGGVTFGVLSDRIGRKKAMTYTILVYSAFTCVSALSQTWWQLAIFRFLVAIGVGGEWAVATALVAEVFPGRSRAWSLSVFHASSVLGTFLAVAAGVVLVGNPRLGWRWGFAVGAVPALLIVWVRSSLREPERWKQARRADADEPGREPGGGIRPLFGPGLLRHTLVGVSLAAVGLATFWGVHVYGKDRLRGAVEAQRSAEAGARPGMKVSPAEATSLKDWEMLGLFLTTAGGGLGLIAFGPLSERVGRRGAFLLFQVGGLAATLVLFREIAGVTAVALFLPVFGFLTLGMHAGYAVYFPELFPTRLRSTGGGFCFNVGRILAAPILFANGWLQKDWHLSLTDACSLLSLLFLIGLIVLAFAPETRGRELPA